MWVHMVLAKSRLRDTVEKEEENFEKVKSVVMKKIFVTFLICISCNREMFLTGKVIKITPVVMGKDTLYKYWIKSKDTVSEVMSYFSGYKLDSTYTLRVKYDNSGDTLPKTNTQQTAKEKERCKY